MDKDEATLRGALPQPAAWRRRNVATPGADAAGPPGMAQLYFAIEAQRSDARALIVQFLAADRGAGVSTVATAYARQAARRSAAAVLLIRAAAGPSPESGPESGSESRLDRRTSPCALDLFQAGLPLDGLPVEDGRLRVATLDDDAAAMLDMRMLENFAAALRRSFDLVVLDCAPLGHEPLDGALEGERGGALGGALARIADGTIVVVAAGRTRRRGLERTLAEVAGLGGQVVGLVLNRQRDWLPAWLRRLLG